MRISKDMVTTLLLLTLTAVDVSTSSGQTPPDPNLPGPLREVGFEQKLGAQVPLELPFVDESGQDVLLGDYFGDRPVVLALVYYECPMLCTMVLDGLMSSLGVLSLDPGQDFEVVVLSFDPDEGPALAKSKKAESMARYDRVGTESGFHFLVGQPTSIEAVTDAVGFSYVYDEEKDQFAHAAGITVLTPLGQVARYLFGIEYAPKDLRLALLEADQNKIGSVVDQLLLFCYRYDPATGKYGAATMKLIQIGGILVVAGLLAFILASRRRNRHAAHFVTKGTS